MKINVTLPEETPSNKAKLIGTCAAMLVTKISARITSGELARVAGVSQPLLYHYYKARDESKPIDLLCMDALDAITDRQVAHKIREREGLDNDSFLCKHWRDKAGAAVV